MSTQPVAEPTSLAFEEGGITAHHLAFFRTFGYLHIPGYFAEEIGWITDEFEAAWAACSEHGHDGSKRTIYPGVFIAATPRLATLLEHPKMVALCTGLLGAGYGYHATDGNFYSGDTPWHSDAFAEWPSKSIVLHLKVAFYLDRLTRATGALRVIPGSHLEGDRFCSMLCADLPPWNPDRRLTIPGEDIPAVAIESEPGDLVCFDHRIKHASFGGGQRRRMFTTNWIQGACTPEQHESLMTLFRFGHTFAGIDWNNIHGDWFEHPPAAREAVLRQLKTYGPLVMQEVASVQKA